MASEQTIFSLYKSIHENKHYLLRTIRPTYSNVSQTQADLAENREQEQRKSLLKQIAHMENSSEHIHFDFIGEFQGYPMGDKLYADNGKIELKIFYMETTFGKPWIILGNASNEQEFLAELQDDPDLVNLQAVGNPTEITAIFLTENDVDFTKKS